MSVRRLAARFEGHVQGVGFRFTTVHLAQRHRVTGFVRNLSDGDVDLVAEGEASEISAFLGDLRTSSIYRFVRREHLAWSDPRGEFANFDVRYDA
jgi:acylphosphatase